MTDVRVHRLKRSLISKGLRLPTKMLLPSFISLKRSLISKGLRLSKSWVRLTIVKSETFPDF